MTAGRKTKYSKALCTRAKKEARQGLTDEEIAKALGISTSSFYLYISKYSEFSEAIKGGRQSAIAKVTNSLFKRAVGMETIERHLDYTPPGDAGGAPKVKSIREVKKTLAPDVTAQIFFLKNRDPENWKDSHKVDNTSSDGSMSPNQGTPEEHAKAVAVETERILNKFKGNSAAE